MLTLNRRIDCSVYIFEYFSILKCLSELLDPLVLQKVQCKIFFHLDMHYRNVYVKSCVYILYILSVLCNYNYTINAIYSRLVVSIYFYGLRENFARRVMHANSRVLKPIASTCNRCSAIHYVVARGYMTKKRCDHLLDPQRPLTLVHLLVLSSRSNEERKKEESTVIVTYACSDSQVQVNLQANVPQPTTYDSNGTTSPVEDDIDAALTDLQVTLEGSNISNGPSDITHVPELCDELRFFKPKRFTLKAYKRYWFTCRDLQLRLYKSRVEASGSESPAYVINLRGCEVTPDVYLSQGRYGIRLEVPSAEGMTEMWIRCDNVSSINRIILTS